MSRLRVSPYLTVIRLVAVIISLRRRRLKHTPSCIYPWLGNYNWFEISITIFWKIQQIWRNIGGRFRKQVCVKFEVVVSSRPLYPLSPARWPLEVIPVMCDVTLVWRGDWDTVTSRPEVTHFWRQLGRGAGPAGWPLWRAEESINTRGC